MISIRKPTTPDISELTIKTLNFRPDLIQAILDGTKTATTRLRPSIGLGEAFQVHDNTGTARLYRITMTDSGTIQRLANRNWRIEGYYSPIEMYLDLMEIYPQAGPDTPAVTIGWEVI